MASRFPSIEDFDDGQTSPRDPIENSTSLFDRERAALGDAADEFSFGDNDANAFPDLDAEGDLLGGSSSPPQKMSSFEDSFPSLGVDDNEAVGPGGSITGVSQPYSQGTFNTNNFGSSMEEEPEVIKQWRERQALEIQERDKQSESKKQDTIEKANKSIDDFYENYNSKKDKSIEQTHREAEEFLASRENTSAGGTAWERIAKLVDLSDKGARSGKSDKTRFREMLVSLRKDEKAPGASVSLTN